MLKNLKKNTNCTLKNVNLEENHFDSFTEIIKIEK